MPLAPFRTWRNTVTGEASEKLTELFRFHIPQRWTIAHLYQSVLSGEEHVHASGYLTTLAGYVHWRLTGEKKVGLGEASGIFPLDSETLGYDAKMTEAFEARRKRKSIRGVLPIFSRSLSRRRDRRISDRGGREIP